MWSQSFLTPDQRPDFDLQRTHRLAPVLEGLNYGWTGSGGRVGDADALRTRAI